jgi:effector-binding domain-containing protein
MIAVYTKFLIKEGVFEYLLGYMIPESLILPTQSSLREWRQGAGRALHVEHIGSYRHLGNAWSVANQIARHKKLKQCRTGTYEIYTTTPPQTPEALLQTDIYLPLR